MSSQQPYYNASSSPVVVQGVLINNNPPNNNNTTNNMAQIYDHKHVNHGVGAMEISDPPHNRTLSNNDEATWIKGEVQPRRCNDAIFAILFYGHLGLMAFVAARFAPQMYSDVAETAMNGGGGRDRDLMLEGEIDLDGGENLYRNGDGLNDYAQEEQEPLNSSIGGGWKSRMIMWMANSANHRILVAFFGSNNNNNHDRQLQEDDYKDYGTNDIGDMMLLLGISALLALVISTAALSFMIRHAQLLIKFALLFNIGATAVFAIGSLFLSPFAAFTGVMLFALTVYYAYVVWGRIPFAACNLVTATTAVKSNLGLAFFAYGSLFVMIGWSAWWMVSFVSTLYVTCGCDGQGNCEREPSGLLFFVLLLSYYWTFQVIKNVVHVTVAGTVGTWWFVPSEGSSCCSQGVRDSFVRSVTHSFGSICLGSLLVAIVEASKAMVKSLRESEDGGGILLCLAECLLSCLEDILEYFNTWAFVFVGIYGYTFLEAGKNVINLFKTRGWTTIITDNLAQGVLGMVSAAVGLITGIVALGIAQAQGMVFGDELGASAASFFIGFIIGAVVTSTLMTLVSSAVNTVIVCYAEAPREFEENHPKLSEEMRGAWRQAWPAEFHY